MTDAIAPATRLLHKMTPSTRFIQHPSSKYDTIAAIKAAIRIPVLANGDIQTPEQARAVLEYTGADGVMIGRAAQGRPWLCGQIAQYLREGHYQSDPAPAAVREILLEHLAALHEFYGEQQGARIARKHIGWYLAHRPGGVAFQKGFNQLIDAAEQHAALQQFFTSLTTQEELAA